MGNSASGTFTYDIGNKVEVPNSQYFWQIYDGVKKDSDKRENERVTIFKMLKTQSDKLIPAQRHIQKLKTMKHPYILSYLDATSFDDSCVLVTEYCVPLSVWMLNFSNNESGSFDKRAGVEDILWGIRCILTALDFLHSRCLLSHNNVCLNSIFVVNNGDWKLGSFDLVSGFKSDEDISFFKQFGRILPKEFCPPEIRNDYDISVCGSISDVDVYSLSHLITIIFDQFNITEIPEAFNRFLKRMGSIEPKRRPNLGSVLKSPEFNTDHINLLLGLDNLALQTYSEAQDILGKLAAKVPDVPKSICIYKLLPILNSRFSMAVTDFAVRDSREACRNLISIGLQVLVALVDNCKIDESNFISGCPAATSSLWEISDRVVRTSLLKSCKPLLSVTPASIIGKFIFDPMMAGFGDSNAKMREETLKNLIHIVDKIDDRLLQDRLPKCITNLQNDAENSIRTNATIFLGKLAPKLKDITRNRILCQAFVKAMKDPFLHCRIAGLKAAQACITLVDISQLAQVLLPQVCILTIDKSAEVRSLSIAFVESSTTLLRCHSDTMIAIPTVTASGSAASGDKSPKVGDGSVPTTGGWTTWAVDELSKAFERVSSAPESGPGGKLYMDDYLHGTTTTCSSGSMESNPPSQVSSLSQSLSVVNESKLLDSVNDGWDHDISWSDDDLDVPKRKTATDTTKQKSGSSVTQLSNSKVQNTIDDTDSTTKPNASTGNSRTISNSKKPKSGALKLGMSSNVGESENWEDF